jgi:hypothetical protein
MIALYGEVLCRELAYHPGMPGEHAVAYADNQNNMATQADWLIALVPIVCCAS